MIQTSYYGKSGSLPNAVCISTRPPDWLRNRIAEYPDLAPRRDMLKMGTKQYCDEFQRILERLNPQKVAADMEGKVMLCYEKQGEFCHRHIVARWLYDELGIIVPEVTFTGMVQIGPGQYWDTANPTVIEQSYRSDRSKPPEHLQRKIPEVKVDPQLTLF